MMKQTPQNTSSHRTTTLHWGWILTALLLATFCLRAAVMLQAVARDPQLVLTPDSLTYEQPARALAIYGKFLARPEPGAPPELSRTPGYPLLMAACFKLFGIDRRPVLLLQIALSAATLALIFWLGQRLGGTPAAGLLAATLLALDPASFLQSQLLLTETIFTFLMLGLILLAARWSDAMRRQWLWAMALGIGIGCAALVRPIAYFMPLPLCLWLLIAGRLKNLKPTVILASVFSLLLPCALLLGAWQWRNAQVSDFHGFSTISGASLLLYRAAGVVVLRDGITLAEAQAQLDRTAGANDPGISPGKLYTQRVALARQILRAHPGLMLRSQIHGLRKMLLGPGETGLWPLLKLPEPVSSPWADLRRGGWAGFQHAWSGHYVQAFLIACSLAYLLGIYLCMARGLWSARVQRAHWPLHACLILLVLYQIAISVGPEAYARFRVPIMPCFCLYAALGLLAWRARHRLDQQTPLPPPPQV